MTPRTMTEPEAWREIARQIAQGVGSPFVYASATTHSQMGHRAAEYGFDAPMPREQATLAALWLALEAEEEGA
jgi:hypothetical protein